MSTLTDTARTARTAAFIAGVRSVVTPGTTMVISDLPVDKSTQNDPDFKVMGLWDTAQR